MDINDKTAVISNSLNCSSCGSVLHYEPGTEQLKCGHCGSVNDITNEDDTDNSTDPYDYDEFVEYVASKPTISDLQSVKCENCGSVTVLSKNVTASKCSFCASPLILEFTDDQVYVQPHYILPFMINEQAAKDIFNIWIKKLKFAPSDLVAKANSGQAAPLDGVYLPYWAFDADAQTDYEGERGDYYWETEYYTETVNGEDVERSREVRRTQWTWVSDTVNNDFSNITVAASNSLPPEKLNAIALWDIDQIVAYDERYISGFRAESYQLSPQEGLSAAGNAMNNQIKNTIAEDIGGDEQRIGNTSTKLDAVGIKYILMPVWINSFNYNGKLYHFIINGRTGLVNGERPYSAKKIALLVLIILAALALLFFLSYLSNKP